MRRRSGNYPSRELRERAVRMVAEGAAEEVPPQ